MPTDLPDNIKKLFVIFKDAINAERAAQATYLRAKELTDDVTLKEVFEGFYNDELRHESELAERYDKLREGFNIKD